MTFLDTHVWLWWLSGSPLLSKRALAEISKAIDDSSLVASSISVWEAEMLVKKGRLELRLSVDDLVTHCEGLPFFNFVSVSAKIGVKAVGLEPFHPDPADRVIVASTVHHGAVLITKDERIQKFKGVRSLW